MTLERPTLLPRNATTLDRALEQSTARVADVPMPIKDLWDPWTCPVELLPWLAWALSTDNWELDWTEDQKRETVANAIEIQRKKGTPASIESVLARYDELLALTEWFEMQPVGEPHTFDIDLPLISANGDLGGERSSAAFAEAIIRDVTRTKPARSHFRLLQSLEGEATIDVIGAGRIAGYRREDCLADAATGTEPVWNDYLQTANGEPLATETGDFIQSEGLNYGPELIANGQFLAGANGADDWNATNSTLGAVHGRLRVVNTAAGSPGSATQDVPVEAGKTYHFTGSGFAGSITGQIRIGSGAGQSDYGLANNNEATDFVFTATGTAVHVQLYAYSFGAPVGAYAEFDNISLRERLAA